MLKNLNSLLKILPFNGSKTAVGVIVSLILYFLPDFPLDESEVDQVVQTIRQIIEIAANLYIPLGLLHKWIKSKF